MLVVVAILQRSGLWTVALVVIPFAAIPTLALIYWSVRSKLEFLASQEPSTRTGKNSPGLPVGIAFRECLILLPITYSLAFLAGMFLETQLSFLGLGMRPGEPSLGLMIAEGRGNLIDIWWLFLLPLGVVALSVVALLGIVLPIRRVQKQSDLLVQPNPTVMNYAGFWVRMASITIDALVLIAVDVLLVIAIDIFASIGLAQNVVGVILIAINVLYTIVYLGGYRSSLGHRLLGIRVVRSNGERVGLARSILRGFLILFLSGILVLAILFSRRRQALYDILSDTVVVRHESLRKKEQRACPQCGRRTVGDSNFCMECGWEMRR